MKNRFIIVYSIFASIVFLFSLSFFGFNLYKEYITNLDKSEIKLSVLTNDVRTISYNQSENNQDYSKALKDAIGDANAYSFIQIKRSDETIILYPAGKIKEETISKLIKTYECSLTVNEQPVEIYCNYYLIRPDSIFYFARISFLLILIITLITIIMIIYLNMTETTSSSVTYEEVEENNQETETQVLETENETVSIEPVEDNSAINQVEEQKAEEKIIDEANQEIKEEQTEPEPEKAEQQSNIEVTPEEVQAILGEPLMDEQQEESDNKNPEGLYDPETGIGWESYLMTRLDNEIDRATASEIDLALFVIQMSNISKQSEGYKNVCNYLAIEFQFKDLLFEYKDDCIVAIKISMNVDEAINLANKLHSDICNILDGSNCRIGISTRSIRMVTGERLMLEAEQAIEHSDDTSPIIAFRVDSEKYRQLMEQNQKN